MNNQINEIVTNACKELELEFYDIEYKKEHSSWILRVLADTEEGIKIDQCVALNKLLCDRITDEMIPNEYNLEVSSPGIERRLRNIDDIEKSIGKYVYIKTFEKLNDQKEFSGHLLKIDGEIIFLEDNIEIPYDKIATIRLAIKF